MSIEESNGGFTISPSAELFADWSSERLGEFKKLYPDEWEGLKRGYIVEVPALPPEFNAPPERYVERWKELHQNPGQIIS